MTAESFEPPTLLHVFPTFVAAGAQMRTLALMEALGGAWRHRVLALDGRLEGLAVLERARARAAGGGSGPEPSGGLALDVEGLERDHPSGPLGGLRAARARLLRMRPDLCLTYNWGSFDYVLGARSLGLPHLHHEDGFNADEAHGQKRRRVLARRYGLRRARRVIVPSMRLERCALDEWRLPAPLVRRIPNGVRLERFRADAAAGAAFRAELGIPADALVVGSVGHLRPVKNFGRLIRAVAALPRQLEAPGVHLVILGEGGERASLEALARTHMPPGGRVHLPGHRGELASAYSAFDVFCLSSDSEQFPVSLLEAMACERACAATDVGDIRAVLPPEARDAIVPLEREGPPAELTAALARLLADPDHRAVVARAGHERCAREYSFDAMVNAYDEEYRRALGPRGSADALSAREEVADGTAP